MLFRHVDAGHERVEIDDVEQMLADLHLVAQVDEPGGDRAGDRCANLGVAQLSLRIVDGDLELVELVRGIVVRLLADQLLGVQSLLPLVLPLGLRELARDLRQGAALSPLGQELRGGDEGRRGPGRSG